MPPAALPFFPTFTRRLDADARSASALNGVRAILAAELMPAHRRELLSVCIWKLTLAEPANKYATRFVSTGAIACSRKERVHEHVFERAKLVQLLIAGHLRPEDLAAQAIACTVTRDEHARLARAGSANPGIEGWARYRVAAIAVVDRMNLCWQVEP